MRISIFFLIMSLSFAASAEPKEFLFLKYKQQIEELSITPTAYSDVYLQKTDHNNPKDTSTFQQRYWYNNQHANGFDGPVLLYICGEGECGSYAVTGTMAKHAQNLKAHVVALEHRYYGRSQPFKDLTTESLKYLTIDQALKDLVAFKKHIQTQFKITGPWIAVGGSYAGAMAAYLRSQYPSEFVGALASSGPVQADNDFSEYDLHVSKMAGPKCLSAIQSVVSEIESKIQTDKGFETVKAQFNASVLRDRDDFLYLVADTAAAAVQYGMRTQFCNLVVENGLQGYAEGAELVSQIFGNLTDLSVQMAESTSLESASGSIGMRQWFYQSCTEFGFWQNAYSDSNWSSRSKRINSDYHQKICERLFGFKKMGDVDQTNQRYLNPIVNDQNPQILFTNGNEDPWINLSIANDKINPKLSVFVIQDGAHCDDLTASTSPEVLKAQNLFIEQVSFWLKH